MHVQQAIDLPHLVNRFGTYDVEGQLVDPGLVAELAAMGFEMNPRVLNSGLHAISLGDGLLGGADPRREGVALGE